VRVTLVAIASVLAACVGDDDWSGIRNPLVSLPDVAVKDAYLVHDAGTWQLGYSRIIADPFRFQLGFSSSSDLRALTHREPLDQLDTGGLASPFVVRAPDGRWLMTYNTHTTDVGGSLSNRY
jgi:hypothetical protein